MTIYKILCFTLLLFVTRGNGTTPPNITNEQAELLNSINKFSNGFYSEVVNTSVLRGKDAIMSALSAQLALTILSLGARGETLNQLNNALFLPNSTFAKSAFRSEIDRLNQLQGVILNIVNKIYIKQNYNLNPSVQNEAKESFFSQIENIDFGNVENAVKVINAWVEQNTNNKITNILTNDMIDSSLILLIINAIYFKGTWEKQFDPKLTTKKDFLIDATRKGEVDMMTQKLKTPYVELKQLDAQAIELYYVNRNVSMVIILPNKVDGLNDLEKQLQRINIKKDIFDNVIDTEVSLSLPKFKLESSMDLQPVVINLGAKLIFDAHKADLSSLLTQKEQLYVSYIIQKAFIEVNEEGSEAAAVTVIGVGRSIARSVIFNADHPFLFFIKSYTGEILFSGRFQGTSLPVKITTPTEKPPTRKPLSKKFHNIFKRCCTKTIPRK